MKNKDIKMNLFEYLSDQPPEMKHLFIKVLNLHAGYKLKKQSNNELLGEIKKSIEEIAKK